MTITTDNPEHFTGSAKLLEAQMVRGDNVTVGWIIYMPGGQRTYLAYSFKSHRAHSFNDRVLAVEWIQRS